MAARRRLKRSGPARRSDGGRLWGASEGRAAVDAWKRSGQELADFCRTRGVSYNQLYWWKRKLEASTAETSEDSGGVGAFAPVKVLERAEAKCPVVEESEARGLDGDLEVVVGNGRRIRVGRDFDPGVLVRLLSTLEGLSC